MLCSFSSLPPYCDEAIIPWSHYAEGHRGVVLQFDSKKFSSKIYSSNATKIKNDNKITPGIFYKVKYRKKPIRIRENTPFQAIKGPLLSKAAPWAYEKEYRVFCQVKSYWSEPVDNRTYTNFGCKYINLKASLVKNGRICVPFPKDALEVVFFGCQSDINYSDKLRNRIHKILSKYKDCSYDYINASNNRYGLEMSL